MAMVSSFLPRATLPISDWLSVHAVGSVKSSSSRIFPVSGRISAVGVTIGVGKAVEVAVGGNHTIVGMTVWVGGIIVIVGVGSEVKAAVQAQHSTPTRQ